MDEADRRLANLLESLEDTDTYISDYRGQVSNPSDPLKPTWSCNGIDLYLGDSREILPRIEYADFCITDPPYIPGFEWVWEFLGRNIKRILPVGGSLVTLCGHVHIPEALDNLRNSGLRYWWIAGMRHTIEHKLVIGKYVVAQFKPALWFVNETRKGANSGTKTPFDMVPGTKNDKSRHKWQQPTNWFEHWIDNLSEEGEIVIDPFMGSGTTGEACIRKKRRFIGIEINPYDFDQCVERMKDTFEEIGNG